MHQQGYDMDNQLIPYNGKQITPLGSLFVKQESETLFRVKKYRINFIDKTSKEITYQQYDKLSKLLQSQNIPRFIEFESDGEVIATAQIASVKPYETIVDTRREEL